MGPASIGVDEEPRLERADPGPAGEVLSHFILEEHEPADPAQEACQTDVSPSHELEELQRPRRPVPDPALHSRPESESTRISKERWVHRPTQTAGIECRLQYSRLYI